MAIFYTESYAGCHACVRRSGGVYYLLDGELSRRVAVPFHRGLFQAFIALQVHISLGHALLQGLWDRPNDSIKLS